ncbi:unnamed protein product [Auanema sp. JU1783]|nr:unnamed protein product [Auanema sp. JU1783]
MKRHTNVGYVDDSKYKDFPNFISSSGGFCNIMTCKINFDRKPTFSAIGKFLKPEVPVRWLIREMYILKRLKHQNIICYVGHTYHKFYGYGLFVEYMDCGDLHNIIADPTIKYTWDQLGSWSGQLLLALEYLECRGIVHSDLNTKNILLKNSMKIIKVADFGSARNTNERMITENMFHYCNPSIFTGEPLTSKSDIFAFGMILWWMVYRRDPFYGFDTLECNYLLVGGVRPRTEENQGLAQIFAGKTTLNIG